MEWALWWGVGLTCVLVLLLLPWRATDNENRDPHDQDPPETEKTPAAVRPSAARYVGTEPRPPANPGRCHACGTDNDPSFTYCRECLTRL